MDSALTRTLAPLDWAIVASFLVVSLLVGLLLKRRAEGGMADYFVSGRRLPWWALGTSMVATTFAADTPLAVTGWVRTAGVWKNWFWWNYILTHVFVVFVFARLWRRAEVITDNELIELRYSGRPAAFLRGFKAFYFSTAFNLVVMGWVISAMAKVLRVFFGVEPLWAVVVSITVAVLYTMLSGLWGVVATDVLQYGLALLGTVALAVAVVGSPEVGGLGAFWHKAHALGDHLSFFVTPGTGGPAATQGGWFDSPFFVFLVYVTVVWWSSHNSDGGGYIIQRLSSAKDERHAVLGMGWFALNHYVLRLWPWVVVAAASLIVYPDASVTGGDQEAVYVAMVERFLGPGLRGVVFVAFLSAFMSTLSTQLNWGVSYVMNDLYRRFVRKGASATHYVAVARIATVALAAAAGVVALQIGSIGKAWVFLWAMSAGIGLVLVLRWFWWRINAWSEIAALASSIVAIAGVAVYVRAAGVDMALKHQIVVVPVSVAVSLAVTLLTRPEPEERLVEFYRRIRPWGWWGPVKRKAGACSPSEPLGPLLVNWLLGVVALASAMVGVGKCVLGYPVWGVLSLAVAAAAGVWLWVRLAESGPRDG